jgi:ACT domain-containing protein
MTTTRDSPDGIGPDGIDVVRLVVRVWLPDRPGALGLVASRIGAIGADIVGVDVLERSEHVAVDEFAVTLESEDLVKLLVREIEEVDGASVEQWERVERFPDPLDALETIEHVSAAGDVDDLVSRLTARVRAEFNADWAAVLRESVLVATAGDQVPGPSVLHAVASGVSASPAVAAGDSGPDDLAVAPLAAHGSFLLVGRVGHPFRRRERRQLLALARVADRLSAMLA